jgi:chromosome segregation and condensation protein ScpB
VLYATTSSFLQHFGLNALEDLPKMPEAPADDGGEPES